MTRGTSRTTRLRKAHCLGCGYTIRLSRQWIAVGLPDCPQCHFPLSCPEPADLVETGLIDIDELPRPDRTAMCHRMGWQDSIVRTNRAQQPGFGAGRKRPRVPEPMPF